MENKLNENDLEFLNPSDLYNLIKVEKQTNITRLLLKEEVEFLLNDNDNIQSLIFQNCIFKSTVDFKGIVKNGIIFENCIFESVLNFEINVNGSTNDNTTDIGALSSLVFSNCEIFYLHILGCALAKGIHILNNCLIYSLHIENIKVTEKDIFKLVDSKIIDYFIIDHIGSNHGISIINSEILTQSIFKSINIGDLIFNKNKFENIFFAGCDFNNGIIIRESEFNGTINFSGTTVMKKFNLKDSTFKKEFMVSNYSSAYISHYQITNCNFEEGFIAQNNDPSYFPHLSLSFSNSLKGSMLFENIAFFNVKLSGFNNNLALTFNNCQFTFFNMDDMTNNQSIRLSKCQANSHINIPSVFHIHDSNLGKLNLLNVDFKSFTNISIVNSFISDIQFASVKWFDKHQLTNSNQENRETFRQLKLAAEKSSDNIAAIDFKGNELYYYHKYLDEITPKSSNFVVVKNPYIYNIFYFLLLFLNTLLSIISFLFSKRKAKYNISNKMILWLARVSNNYGSSWTRPLFLILGFNLFFFVLMGISLSNKISWAFDPSNIGLTCSEVTKHFSLFFQLLNPTHDINRVMGSLGIDTAKETVSWTVYAFDFIHRIIYAYLIYQLVVAFRKYVK